MTASPSLDQTIQPAVRSERRFRSRRARAVLAGGLALGVGAAITLAAWNESEFVTGLFGSGDFGIEGSTDGLVYAEHATAGTAAALTFEIDSDNLAPSEAVYSGFAVQLTSTSTSAAAVSVAASSSAAIASSLSYSVVEVESFGCDATSFGTGTPLVTGAAVAASSAADIFTLDAVTDPTFLCFQVMPSADLPQGVTSGAVLWELAAESTTTLP